MLRGRQLKFIDSMRDQGVKVSQKLNKKKKPDKEKWSNKQKRNSDRSNLKIGTYLQKPRTSGNLRGSTKHRNSKKIDFKMRNHAKKILAKFSRISEDIEREIEDHFKLDKAVYTNSEVDAMMLVIVKEHPNIDSLQSVTHFWYSRAVNTITT